MDQAKLPTTKEQFQAILSHIADGVVVQDMDAQVVYVNPAAAKLLGFSSVSEALDAGRDKILLGFNLFDEKGQPLPREMLPGRQALRGAPEPAQIVRARSDESGETTWRWGWIKATPIHDTNHRIEYVVTVFQEITQLKNTELRLKDANQRITNLLEQMLKFED